MEARETRELTWPANDSVTRRSGWVLIEIGDIRKSTSPSVTRSEPAPSASSFLLLARLLFVFSTLVCRPLRSGR